MDREIIASFQGTGNYYGNVSWTISIVPYIYNHCIHISRYHDLKLYDYSYFKLDGKKIRWKDSIHFFISSEAKLYFDRVFELRSFW